MGATGDAPAPPAAWVAAGPAGLGVRHSLRVNGRAGGGRAGGRPRPGRSGGTAGGAGAAWQVRLGLAWEPDTHEHAWLSLVCDPPRPGVASGVWLLPLALLERAVHEPVSVGTVRLTPDAAGRVLVELTASVAATARPWTTTVPRGWLSRFVEEVTAARTPPTREATA